MRFARSAVVAIGLLLVVFLAAGAAVIALLATAEWLRQIQRVLEWL